MHESMHLFGGLGALDERSHADAPGCDEADLDGLPTGRRLSNADSYAALAIRLAKAGGGLRASAAAPATSCAAGVLPKRCSRCTSSTTGSARPDRVAHPVVRALTGRAGPSGVARTKAGRRDCARAGPRRPRRAVSLIVTGVQAEDSPQFEAVLDLLHPDNPRAPRRGPPWAGPQRSADLASARSRHIHDDGYRKGGEIDVGVGSGTRSRAATPDDAPVRSAMECRGVRTPPCHLSVRLRFLRGPAGSNRRGPARTRPADPSSVAADRRAGGRIAAAP